MWFDTKQNISSLQVILPREEILRRSRLLIVDDERPELIEDLKKARFSVDHEPDITSNNMDMIERPLYDLILLDFGNVGKSFGSDQGLSLLRHIKRLNPSVVVIAYTSKALTSEHADFYRLTDGVLAKDAGIASSLEKIEEGLRKAHSIQNVWAGLIAIADIKPGSKEDKEWQHLFIRGLHSGRQMKKLKSKITAVAGEAAQKVGIVLLEKVVELSIKSLVGG